MSDLIFPEGTHCEISPHRPTKDTSMPQKSIPEMYSRLNQAKTKAEWIQILWENVQHNDIPREVWEKKQKYTQTGSTSS